jgi:hypothetical protein
MRIWDLPPHILCRQHLLGEHQELHALWTILSEDRQAYRRHPETIRWVGKLAALYARHEMLVDEMHRRCYAHRSPLDPVFAVGQKEQHDYVDPPHTQLAILRQKECACDVSASTSAGCGVA